jgi:hypothetical protein
VGIVLASGCHFMFDLGNADATTDDVLANDEGSGEVDAESTEVDVDRIDADGDAEVDADPDDAELDADGTVDGELDADVADVPASCRNRTQDGTETDIDCGGLLCPRCEAGRICLVHTDCNFRCEGGFCTDYATIVLAADTRRWRDETEAVSCEDYIRPPDTFHRYEGSTGSGLYWIHPVSTDSPLQVWCDMTTTGGGWTLVASHSLDRIPPTPDWLAAVNENNCVPGIAPSSSPADFDQFLGVKYWSALGPVLRIEMGDSPSAPIRRAYYDFLLAGTAYTMALSNEYVELDLGAGDTRRSWGMYSYGGAVGLSTFDSDHDLARYSCSSRYGSTAWWFEACWCLASGFWGDGGTGLYQNAPYWAGCDESTSQRGITWFPWGGIFIGHGRPGP